MKGKIAETKFRAVVFLIFGVVNLLIYTEIFGNHDKYSGLWLLNTVFNFCMFIIQGVKLEILRINSYDRTNQ